MMNEMERIDAAFDGMSADLDYQNEALLISEEFSASDAEVLEISDREVEAGLDDD